MATVQVFTDRRIAFEVGLVRDPEHVGCFAPGPRYRRVQLERGVNQVDAAVAREWLRKNTFLECVKRGQIRLVDGEATPSQAPCEDKRQRDREYQREWQRRRRAAVKAVAA